jgi:hypothetical protein
MVRQQCKWNALLHSNGNIEHVYVADSHIYADINKGRYCYDYMATIVTVRSTNVYGEELQWLR